MSLLTQNTLARDQNFQSRVRMAAVIAAIAVINESTLTPNHANRIAYAKRVLSGQVNFITKLSYLVVTNQTIATTAPTGVDATDGDIQYVVNSLWDILSTEV